MWHNSHNHLQRRKLKYLLMKTYGQLIEGKIITYEEYSKEVANRLRKYIVSNYKLSEMLCRKLYNKGYSIADACSFLILNAKN